MAPHTTLPPEDHRLEYKREMPPTEKLARTMVAMANTKGGRIVIGVTEEPRSIVGVTPDQRVEEHVTNVASEVCSPAVECSISYETASQRGGRDKSGTKVLLVIDVAQGVAKPYYVKKMGLEKGTFIRVGSTCRVVDREGLQRLLREGQHRSFDQERVTLPHGALSERLLVEYLERRVQRLGGQKLAKTRAMLTNLDLVDGERCTVAGALLFCENPQSDPQLHAAAIRAARFRGTKPGDFIDQQEIAGAVSAQIERAVQFVVRNTPLRRRRVGTRRDDIPEYPVEVIREVITNAVVHRDYSRRNEVIQLAIFDDRIEVTSPGSLPGTVTVETLLHRQCSRNPIIAKRLFEMGYLEAWGLGIDTIVEWSRDAGRKPPVFRDENDQFTCIVYGESAGTNGVHEARSVTTAEQEVVIELVRKHGQVRNAEIRDVLGISKMQAQTLLTRLTSTKILKRLGRGRGVHYVLRG